MAHAHLLDTAGLEHLADAVADIRRCNDTLLVTHLRTALDEAARADARWVGPRQVLPVALGIVGAIDTTARERPAIRQELPTLGARAAELTAWVHRDDGAPPQATTYWHDRAIEWATPAGDGAMHAYVLLRRAQVTDRHDALRMRDLARMAARGPWRLPPRARAEVLQQEARALALAGAPHAQVARTLDEAGSHRCGARAAGDVHRPLVRGLHRRPTDGAECDLPPRGRPPWSSCCPAPPAPADSSVRTTGPGVLHRPPRRRPRRRRRSGRRSPHPSSEAAAIASTRASSTTPTSALRSSSSSRIRNAGASPSSSWQNRSASERRNPTRGSLASSTRHSEQPAQPRCQIM